MSHIVSHNQNARLEFHVLPVGAGGPILKTPYFSHPRMQACLAMGTSRRRHGQGDNTESDLIRGHHHIKLCTSTAQSDVDFFVKVIGQCFITRTLFYDGRILIYHLYFSDAERTTGTTMTIFPMPGRREPLVKRLQPESLPSIAPDFRRESGFPTGRLRLPGPARHRPSPNPNEGCWAE
jgi:catechol 2,3-dioxygenase-like lactoylglutathione lyase family enzyme